MFRLITVIAISSLIFISQAESQVLKRAKDYQRIDVKVTKTIPLPKGWHEGLFYDGKNIWVCNGRGGKVWVVDPQKGTVVSEITPVASFTEGIARQSEDTYFVTDWDEKKLYRAKIDNGKMSAQAELSFEPAHVAGVAFVGKRLFVITWRRGLGTKFNIIEVDNKMDVISEVRIKDIQEPAHMAWDGHYLWMTSHCKPCARSTDTLRRFLVWPRMPLRVHTVPSHQTVN